MSSVTVTDSTLPNNEMETTHINHILMNTNMNSSKIDTSAPANKFETATFSAASAANSNQSLPLKTQVLPVVYFQTPQKLNFPSNTKPNNMIVNNVPQFQFASLGTNTANKNPHNITLSNITVPGTQSVILAPVNNQGKPQQIVIQKPGNVVPAYLTMLKPVNKTTESTSSFNQTIQVTATNVANFQDNLQLVSSASLQGASSGKYVIAPMPKITPNRLPATVTTNSVQPKIAFMPLTVPTSGTTDTITKQKIFNFRISDGQIQPGTPLKLIPSYSTQSSTGQNPPVTEEESANRNNLICNEIIDLESPEKEQREKTYELSIEEDKSKNPVVTNLFNVAKQPDGILTVSPDNTFIIQKEQPKFTKHGVSILKKNYPSFTDRRQDTLQNTTLITKISSSNSYSESSLVDTSTPKPSSSTEETIILQEPKVIQKSERRRKSNFCYRKEYDDMEIETYEFPEEKKQQTNIEHFKESFENSDLVLTKLSNSESVDVNENKEKINKNVELEVIKETCEPVEEDTTDMQKLLKWEEGIGTLPGSNLKFIINEFNLIEYVTPDEYNKILEKRIAKAKEREKTKDDFNEEMQCAECGCYGLPSEFISPKYCSYDCQEAGDVKFLKEKEAKLKKKKKRVFAKKSSETFSNDTNNKVEKEQSGSDDDNTSNENSQDLRSYPWACSKKGFSWSKYLDHVKAKAAPVKLFKDAFPYTRNGFRPGMKLEGIDPQHPSYFCVLSIAEVIGYRVRLHFDGYQDNYDFWVNADSMDIFPIGWCEKYGHDLHPPPGYTMENFNWVNYLKQTKSTAAPKHLFANRAGNAICPNGFRVGMKLEAVDRKNTSLVCVATIRDMMDNRILVHFDSWDDIYDYWADPTSPYIHPVGWCDQYGHSLTPPNDYPNPEGFTWERYLKDTKSVPAPVRAFKQRPACGFKRGMRLECVDKRVPQIIRVATVNDVKEHQIRIHFDGWPERYGYWVDDDSPDIHPVGWCQKTGHPIEPPLTPDDVYDFLECPTVGCRGVGHIKGPKYPTHSNQKFCPYAEENLDLEKFLPDRLLSPDLQIESVIPVQREPKEKTKSRLGRPPKYAKMSPPKPDPEPEPIEKKPMKRKYIKHIKPDPEEEIIKKKAVDLLEDSKIMPAEKESWMKHSKFLKRYLKIERDAIDWTVAEVCNFVRSLPNCEPYSTIFREHDIDGESMLSLSQSDIIDILKVKLGPAVKLYNSIVLLRNNAV